MSSPKDSKDSIEAAVSTIHDVLFDKWRIPTDNLNEVYPGIFIGDEVAAKNIDLLKQLKITHILNAAWSEGPSLIYVNTSQGYYSLRNFPCTFMGIRAIDTAAYKLSRHFEESTDFIASAIDSGGKILVHCRQGISRSATLVITYLMMRREMRALEAITLVKKKRNIFPNPGFVKEICILDESIFK